MGARRYCTDCGAPFTARASYATRCWTCWSAWKQASTAKPEVRTVTVADPRLPILAEWTEMLPRLLRLAHPDRHGNSQMANIATVWLLKQRSRLEAQ